jgi:hypothetical protein
MYNGHDFAQEAVAVVDLEQLILRNWVQVDLPAGRPVRPLTATFSLFILRKAYTVP